MGEQNVILKLRDVTKHFGGVRAVDSVDLQIEQGEIHGLIGPNGAGKSTIFKLVMGLLQPTRGEIFFKGKSIARQSTWQRARNGIGIKMQIPGVFLNLSMRENIRIAAQPYHPAHEVENEIDRILRFVRLHGLGNPQVKNMPHGQQQWLEIGMALAARPSLILLDEAAAGMGPEETGVTVEMVRRIREQGITIVFIDHDMDFVKQIAERITVLHYGKVYAQGTHAEIEEHEGVREIYLGKR